MAIQDGLFVTVKFDQPISGNIAEHASAFKIFAEEHVYSSKPDGSLSRIEVPFISVTNHPTEENAIRFEFAPGNAHSLQKCAGDIYIQYTGGTLYGPGGLLLPFSYSFTPSDIAYRGDISNIEHFEIGSITQNSVLTQITYTSAQAQGEHFTVVGASSSATLTNIHDI